MDILSLWPLNLPKYERRLWIAFISLLVLGLLNARTGVITGLFNGSPKHLPGLMSFYKTPVAKADSVSSGARVVATAAQAQILSPDDAADSTDIRDIAREMNAQEFGDQYWPALNTLWEHESGWRPSARNRSSGACGIPQALPCGKIPDMSPEGQVLWGLNYIAQRYGNPANAWRFWQAHHWY